MRRPRNALRTACAERAERIWIDHGGDRIAVYRWGEPGGPAVLFFHGWNDDATAVASLIDPLLAAGWTVWSFDGRGHGESAGRSTNIVNLGAVAGEVHRLAGDVRGLIGHSMGGMVLSYCLQEHGLRDVRVVLISSLYTCDLAAEGFRKMTGISVEMLDQIRRRSEERTGKGWYQVSGETLVKRQTAPVLIIHDDQDKEVPLSQAEQIQREWQGSTLHVTQGLGHRRILADPDVAARAVAFLGSPT